MKRDRFLIGLAVVGAIALLGTSLAQAAKSKYKEAPVSNGAALSGQIIFKGTPPPPKKFEFAKFPQAEFCSKADSDGKGHRLLYEVTVKDGKLQDVVVMIKGIESGKPMKFEKAEVHADTCRFLVQGGPSQFVGVVVNKGLIKVTNLDADPSDPKSEDGVLHNPHSYEKIGSKSSTIFNLPLPTKGGFIEKKVKLRREKKGSIFYLECDQHNYMNVHLTPVKNPYYAIIGEGGTFSIDQIPPGKYTVVAWHPILGTQKQEITFTADGKQNANFEFSAK